MRLFRLLFLPLLIGAAPAAAPPPTAGPLIVAFGDSLTAGYGLEPGLGFAPQLEATLRRHGIAATVEDAGVSGDTTSGARGRLGWTLDGLGRKPDLVIVELGGNDMLRSVDTRVTRDNLAAMAAELKRRDIPVLIAGMRAVRNADPAYVRAFEDIYPRLAREQGVPLYPFFLEGAALQQGMMQQDGLHPTFEGVKRIVTGITPAVKAALPR